MAAKRKKQTAAKRKPAARRTRRAPKRTSAKVTRPEQQREVLLAAIASQPGLSPSEYAKLTGISREGMRRVSSKLRREGLVRSVGHTQATRWYPGDGRLTPSVGGAPEGDVVQLAAVPEPEDTTSVWSEVVVNGHVNVKLMEALGIEPQPATLLAADVIVVGDGIYRIEYIETLS